MSGYSSKFDEWARRPDTKAKLDSANKKAWAQFTNSSLTRTKINSMLKPALMETSKLAQKCFSMKALALQLAFLAQTESIGASK